MAVVQREQQVTLTDPGERETLRPLAAEQVRDARFARWEALQLNWSRLGDDEQEVVAIIADRLRGGQTHYQKLDVSGDPRDWLVEKLYEWLDASVYGAAELIRALRRLGRWPA